MFLQTGHRLHSPWSHLEPLDANGAVATEMYQIMCRCWSLIPAKRPSFQELSRSFQKLIEPGTQTEQIEKNEQEKEKYINLAENSEAVTSHEYLALH